MWPLAGLAIGAVVGAVAGAAGLVMCGSQVARHTRPAAKAVLKAALAAMHEVQVRAAEISEAADDLYAEAKAEVTTEAFAAAQAKAQEAAAASAQANTQTAAAVSTAAGPTNAASPSAKPARKRSAVRRSPPTPTSNG